MNRATIAEVQSDLSRYLEQARQGPVEIEDNGVVVGHLVSGYDPEDELLMTWLSLPDNKARFDASREHAANGEIVSRAEALRMLDISEDELAQERARSG